MVFEKQIKDYEAEKMKSLPFAVFFGVLAWAFGTISGYNRIENPAVSLYVFYLSIAFLLGFLFCMANITRMMADENKTRNT
jgi:hypothetical protein